MQAYLKLSVDLGSVSLGVKKRCDFCRESEAVWMPGKGEGNDNGNAQTSEPEKNVYASECGCRSIIFCSLARIRPVLE